MRFPPNGGNGVRYKVASGGGQRLRPVNTSIRRVLPYNNYSIDSVESSDFPEGEPLYPTFMSLAVIDSLRIVESGICGLDPEIEDST